MLEMITDFLSIAYPWIKSVHVMAVISWMAGIFYLPRLFVHHAEQVTINSPTDALFQMMERKLFRVIMSPAMHLTWTCGLLMVFTPGIVDWTMIWPWLKAFCVIAMTLFHTWLSFRVKSFAKGANSLSGRSYRIMNEVPSVLMIAIVLSVIVKF